MKKELYESPMVEMVSILVEIGYVASGGDDDEGGMNTPSMGGF